VRAKSARPDLLATAAALLAVTAGFAAAGPSIADAVVTAPAPVLGPQPRLQLPHSRSTSVDFDVQDRNDTGAYPALQ